MQQRDVSEVMRERAFVQAQAAKELLGHSLWTKPESLEVLDDLLDQHLRRELRDLDTIAGVVGAFVGECLRRPLEGHWEGNPDQDVRLVLKDGRRLDPVGRARERLREGAVWSLKLYGEAAITFAGDPAQPSPEGVKAAEAMAGEAARRRGGS